MTTQQNENHEQVNSLADEHALRTKTIVNVLTQQRDQANNAIVVLSGEKAVIERRLAQMTTAQQTGEFKTLSTEAELKKSENENASLRMMNANLDSQLTSMKNALEMFYKDVENCTNISSLHDRLGMGMNSEEESSSTEEDGDSEKEPKTLWQRFLSAFS